VKTFLNSASKGLTNKLLNVVPYGIYLLQLGFHPEVVEGRLV